jgi:hypothetical protein
MRITLRAVELVVAIEMVLCGVLPEVIAQSPLPAKVTEVI